MFKLIWDAMNKLRQVSLLQNLEPKICQYVLHTKSRGVTCSISLRSGAIPKSLSGQNISYRELITKRQLL